MVQSPVRPAMRWVKLRSSRAPLRRVGHLGVELDAVEAARLVGDGGEGRALEMRHHLEARRDGVTLSPWLIQTVSRSPTCARPSNSALCAR